MSTRRRQVESFFDVPPEQLIEVKTVMFAALLRRDIPETDARDAVDDVLKRIAGRPESFAVRLTSLDLNRDYFIEAALSAHLARLHGEGWRRRRQQHAQPARASAKSARPRTGVDAALPAHPGARVAS